MVDRAVVAWILPLRGHAFDLADLPIYLHGSTVTVMKRDDGYFLWIAAEVSGEGHERVPAIAADAIEFINGAAGLLIDGFRPIALERGGFFGLDTNGEVANTVLQVDSAEIRFKGEHVTISINGEAQPDQRRGAITALLRETLVHRAKADALALLGRAKPTWSELYLVFELVEANAGGQMYSDGWITKAETKLFTRTANSYTALGRDGRHGSERTAPPSATMSQGAAIALMRALVRNWFKATATA